MIDGFCGGDEGFLDIFLEGFEVFLFVGSYGVCGMILNGVDGDVWEDG